VDESSLSRLFPEDQEKIQGGDGMDVSTEMKGFHVYPVQDLIHPQTHTHTVTFKLDQDNLALAR